MCTDTGGTWHVCAGFFTPRKIAGNQSLGTWTSCVIRHPTGSSCTGWRSFKWQQEVISWGKIPAEEKQSLLGAVSVLCSDTTAGPTLATHVYKVPVVRGRFSASHPSLDICTSPVEKKSFPCRSVFTIYPKTLQFIKMLITTLKAPVQATFFSYQLGMMIWKWNINGEQNKVRFSVLSPARILGVSWEESTWNPILCVSTQIFQFRAGIGISKTESTLWYEKGWNKLKLNLSDYKARTEAGEHMDTALFLD